jgi:hypothetical protein
MIPATYRSSSNAIDNRALAAGRRMARSSGRWRWALATLACTLLGFGPASAHRMPGSLSTIKTNPTSGSIEIIHRLHNHDAELGMITLLGDRTITLDTLVGRAQLALYVEDRFAIAGVEDGSPGAPLLLDLVGAELDGEFVLVYQEYHGQLPAIVAVRDDILRDVFPDQVNHVNIAVGGEVRSLTFSEDDEWHATVVE